MTDKTRAEFEAWASKYSLIIFTGKNEDGQYIDMDCKPSGLEDMWQAWQAALATKAAPEPLAWIRIHPDGSYSNDLLLEWQIEQAHRDSGAWVPLAPLGAPPPAPLREPPEWQPIETAPKAGEFILLWWDGRVQEGYCAGAGASRDGGDWWRASASKVCIGRPTHWMPLPAAPHPPGTGREEGDVMDYCPEKLKPGGCQLHNLQCGYPACNTPPPQAPEADPKGWLRGAKGAPKTATGLAYEKPQAPEDVQRSDGSVEGDTRELRQMLADCEPFLKEGETPAQRIERERRRTRPLA